MSIARTAELLDAALHRSGVTALHRKKVAPATGDAAPDSEESAEKLVRALCRSEAMAALKQVIANSIDFV